MTLRRYNTIPDLPSGYELNHKRSFFGVVIPVARTNLITNPSFETNTTSWTAIGGSIARSTTYQYHGAYSLAITPTATTTDGARYDTVSLTSGTTYAYSAKVRGVAGLKYKLAIETTGGVELVSVTFTANGRWQWIYGYYTETSSTTRRVTVRKVSHTSTAIFYLDGVQVEALAGGERVSTYIDGDQQGLVANQQPPAYLWTGTPHASTSSRSAQTRAGGMVYSLDRAYGFRVLAHVGLGLAAVSNVATPFSQNDGAQYQNTILPPRTFSIGGQFDATTFSQLQRLRSDLYAAVQRDAVSVRQPCVLIYQTYDEDTPIGDELRIPALYSGGLDGTTDNRYGEKAQISFVMNQPLLSGMDGGASLTVQTSNASTNAIAKRTAAGVWEKLSTGLNGSAQAILVASDGLIYVTGSFSTAGGGAAAGIATWNPNTGTWSALGTGLTGGGATGYALAEAPNGDIYVGGDFTNAGGSGADYIAVYTPSSTTWAVVGSATAINNIVRTLAIGPTGIVYAGGDFTNAGGDANADRIAQWSGSAWSALGSGMDNIVRSIAIAPSGTIYATGDFSTADAISAVRIASWNGSAWSAMSTGLTGGGTNRGYKLALGKDGILYVGGTFTAAGGVSANNVAEWNGVAFAPLGSGVNSDVTSLVITPNNQLIVKGAFTSAGGVALTSAGSMAVWTGSAWVQIESDLVGGTSNPGLALTPGGDMYTASGSGTMTSQGITSITNNGSAGTYPRLTINGPSSGTARIHSFKNLTTGRAIYFNYTINAGEIAVLTLQPDNIAFVSDFQGDIMGKIMPGSTPANFLLLPGANSIGFFPTSSTVTAVLQFPLMFTSVDDATW